MMIHYSCHRFWGVKPEDGKKSFCLKDEKLKAFEWKSILKFLTWEGEKEKAKVCRNRWLFCFPTNFWNFPFIIASIEKNTPSSSVSFYRGRLLPLGCICFSAFSMLFFFDYAVGCLSFVFSFLLSGSYKGSFFLFILGNLSFPVVFYFYIFFAFLYFCLSGVIRGGLSPL